MNANGREYVESDLSYEAVGCAMAVINALGHGLREKTYERVLCVAFESRGFSFREQHIYPVYNRGQHKDHRPRGGTYPEFQAPETRLEEDCAAGRQEIQVKRSTIL